MADRSSPDEDVRAQLETGLAGALATANDSPYGLMAGVWTNDLTRAHATADRLDYGMVSVNEYPVTFPATPFGGFKESGLGREQGTEALEE